MKALFVLAALISISAQAADPKIFCQFETPVADNTSGSSYATEYVVKGTLASNVGMMSVKRTEYGVVKVGGKWRINRADVRNPNTVDVHYRGWIRSPKNNSAEWRTYTPQTPVNDGYIAASSLTISNKRVSDEMYSDSYKAIFTLTTMGDESNYTQKVYGICTFSK
ncbi:MAG: hypothetical protein JST80_09450 [Bdellovibrionales bacterium]|nr:hypothetical protein [Bdellovibrionales bacterium]